MDRRRKRRMRKRSISWGRRTRRRRNWKEDGERRRMRKIQEEEMKTEWVLSVGAASLAKNKLQIVAAELIRNFPPDDLQPEKHHQTRIRSGQSALMESWWKVLSLCRGPRRDLLWSIYVFSASSKKYSIQTFRWNLQLFPKRSGVLPTQRVVKHPTEFTVILRRHGNRRRMNFTSRKWTERTQ